MVASAVLLLLVLLHLTLFAHQTHGVSNPTLSPLRFSSRPTVAPTFRAFNSSTCGAISPAMFRKQNLSRDDAEMQSCKLCFAAGCHFCWDESNHETACSSSEDAAIKFCGSSLDIVSKFRGQTCEAYHAESSPVPKSLGAFFFAMFCIMVACCPCICGALQFLQLLDEKGQLCLNDLHPNISALCKTADRYQNLSASQRIVIELFYLRCEKYGFPDSDGTVWGDYKLYVCNHDRFISVLFAGPLNPYTRVERFAVLCCIFCWTFAVAALINGLWFNDDSKNKTVAFQFLQAFLVSLVMQPGSALLNELATASLAHKHLSHDPAMVSALEKSGSVVVNLMAACSFWMPWMFMFMGSLRHERTFVYTALPPFWNTIILAMFQGWVYDGIFTYLNFFAFNSWKGVFIMPQIRQGRDDVELNPIDSRFSLFALPFVSSITTNCLHKIGDRTYWEDRHRFRYGDMDSDGNLIFIPRGHFRNVLDFVLSKGAIDAVIMTNPMVLNNRPTSFLPLWMYCDAEGTPQGPFTTAQMRQWYSTGQFPSSLLIRAVHWAHYHPLSVVYGSTSQVFGGVPNEPRSSSAVEQAQTRKMYASPDATKALSRLQHQHQHHHYPQQQHQQHSSPHVDVIPGRAQLPHPSAPRLNPNRPTMPRAPQQYHQQQHHQ